MIDAAPASAAAERATLTTAEVASLLRCDRKLVYELVKQDALPGVLRLGRAIRFSAAAIQRFLEAR
jgi:excisionase family DNA binding protein